MHPAWDAIPTYGVCLRRPGERGYPPEYPKIQKSLRFDNAPGRVTEKPADSESAKPLIPQKVRNTNGLRVVGINGISISYKLSHEFSVDLYRFSLIPLIPVLIL
jgi:hypothetical protein